MKRNTKSKSEHKSIPANPKPVKTDMFLNKYTKWILSGIIILLLIIIFRDFITGKLYYLFIDMGSDSLNYVYPSCIYISKYLRTEGFPLWSFVIGMGQEIKSISLADPFYFIVFLMKTGNIAYGMIWIELIKIILTAFIFYHFLKLWKLTPISIITGVILYCFSGFIIVGGQWNILSTEACYLALLLLGVEKLYRQNSWYLLPLGVALITIFVPVDLYFYGIFVFIYFLFRYFSEVGSQSSEVLSQKSEVRSQKSDLKPQTSDLRPQTSYPRPQTSDLRLQTSDLRPQTPDLRPQTSVLRPQFYKICLKMFLCLILGIAMGILFSSSVLMLMIDSPRVSGNSSFFNSLSSKPFFFTENKLHYITAILRFFSNDIMGSGDNYKGWNNYLEAPLFYIGLLPLLLMPQSFSYANRRKKFIYSAFILIFILPVIFPYLRYAFWLFTGNYYRELSFFTALTFLFTGLYALNDIDKGRKINISVLTGSLLILIILLYFPYSLFIGTEQIILKDLQIKLLFFLLIYALLIYLFRFVNFRPMLRIVLLLTVFIEISYLNHHSFKGRDIISKEELKEKKGYNDYTIEAINYINSKENHFFRINKEYTSYTTHPSYNDALIQGFYATTSYASFNQKYYIRFLEEMDIIKKGNEEQSRWAEGLMKRPLLLTIASNKYDLTNMPKSVFPEFGYNAIAKFNDVKVYKNRYFLPLGFTYDTYIPFSSFKKLNPVMKNKILLNAFVAEEPIKKEFESFLSKWKIENNENLNKFTLGDYVNEVNSLKQDTLKIKNFSQSHIIGNITLKTPKFLFFSIPYDRGWNAVIDNKKVKPVLCNIGFTGLFLDSGQHEVELYYLPPYFYLTLFVSIISTILYIGLIIVNKNSLKRREII